MRTVSMRLSDLDGGNKLIPIGFQGENEYTTVNIDCKKIFDQHPDAVPALAVTPPKGDSYPAVVVRDGDIVSWTVCDSDLIYEGSGAIQLTFVIDETVIGKTYKARTKVLGSIEPSGETPTPIQNWLIQAAAALQALPAEVASAVAALMGAMVGVGETLDPDDEVTVNYDAANNTLTIGVPHGRDGVDGHTPAITANKVGKVATLYVDGTAIVTISDGTDGDPTALIDDTSTALNRTWSAKKISDEQSSLMTEIVNGSAMTSDAKSDIDQIAKDGYQKYFPEWESGEWNNNGKGTNNNTQRSKSLIYLPSGTYTVYSKIQMSVFGYPTAGATDGNSIQWKLTGEQTITITTRHYVGFMVEMAADDGVPTGNYAVIPSAVSDAIANATKALNTANEAISKIEYSDGIFHVITTGTTLYENKGIGSGILVGAVVNMTNDNYANVLEVPVTAGKTYRMKARVYNNYYLVHFTDDNNILLEKTGKNTSGATATMVDVVATAPAGATKAYLSGMKNTTILCDVLEPYTVKQIIDMETKPTRGSFCIMEFNVGDWYQGIYREGDKTGIIPADETIYANYMSLFNGIFGRYKPDIAMLNEDARYMCLNTHDDDRAFIGQYFRNQYSGLFQSQDKTDVFNTLACTFPMFNLSVRNFTDTESNMHRNYVKGYTYLNGKKVCIISAHLSSNIDIAKLNATELLSDLQTENPEYLICCGDFNYDTNVAEIAAFETAGYTISRGNVVYDGHTYGPGDLIVTTSNITVKSVFCDTQKIDASFVEYIDHLPTVAYLEIF